MTTESIQEMIQSALSTIRISCITCSNKSQYIDSAASHHITSSSTNFYILSSYDGLSKVDIAYGSNLNITRIGNIHSTSLNLNDVFLVPKLSINLISVGQLVENNCKISFSPIGC